MNPAPPVTSTFNPVPSATSLSILLPVHGSSPFLDEAISSCLSAANKVAGSEVVIILDRPEPLSLEVIAKYLGTSGLRITESRKEGLPAALNLGIAQSRSEFVARMDDDDLCHPERFKRQIISMERDESLLALGSQACFIDQENTYLGSSSLPTRDADLRRMLLALNPFVHSSMMYRRDALERVGKYDEGLFVAQDHLLHAKLASIGRVENLDSALIAYRKHPGQHGDYGSTLSPKATLRREVSKRSRAIILGESASSKSDSAANEIYEFVSTDRNWRRVLRAFVWSPKLTTTLVLTALRTRILFLFARVRGSGDGDLTEFLESKTYGATNP